MLFCAPEVYSAQDDILRYSLVAAFAAAAKQRSPWGLLKSVRVWLSGPRQNRKCESQPGYASFYR